VTAAPAESVIAVVGSGVALSGATLSAPLDRRLRDYAAMLFRYAVMRPRVTVAAGRRSGRAVGRPETDFGLAVLIVAARAPDTIPAWACLRGRVSGGVSVGDGSWTGAGAGPPIPCVCGPPP
jgi:hypothetical protein